MSPLYDKIEKLDNLEARCKVSIENISLQHGINYKRQLFVYYELYSTKGNLLDFEYVTIHCVIYAKNGQIIDQDTNCHAQKRFWGLDVDGWQFIFNGDTDINDIGKIRIYPSCC